MVHAVSGFRAVDTAGRQSDFRQTLNILYCIVSYRNS